jgi:hypothetical protein
MASAGPVMVDAGRALMCDIRLVCVHINADANCAPVVTSVVHERVRVRHGASTGHSTFSVWR